MTNRGFGSPGPAIWPWRTDSLETEYEGRLIVFEGPDGVGKTTVASTLVGHLQKQGIDARFHAFPGRTPGTLGKLVHRLSCAPAELGIADEIDVFGLQLLHVAAHVDGLPRVLSDLRKGSCVVLDRCWWSTWAYGLASGVSRQLLDLAIGLETSSWRTVKPACLFLLQREEALHAQPAELLARYSELTELEKNHYPIVSLSNEFAIRDVVMQAAEALTRLRPSPADPSVSPKPQVSSRLTPPRATPSEIRGQQRLTDRTRANGSESFSASPVYDTFWHFAAERQRIYLERVKGTAPPWTNDPILRSHRFTNDYRAADRVSQYLIRNVIYQEGFSEVDTVFRVLLFKLFNKVETWEQLLKTLGRIKYDEFSVSEYSRVLDIAAQTSKIYSAAYIMPPPRGFHRERKYANHLQLLDHMMTTGVAAKIAKARSLRDIFETLLSYQGLGPFLAYQYAIDLNYTEVVDFSESDFVVAGPGALSGIRRCFGTPKRSRAAEIIRIVYERQETEFETRGLRFDSLWGRRLQLIDCQNLFCEVDKYARLAHPEVNSSRRRRIKQKFSSTKSLDPPWFPPKWGINTAVAQWRSKHAFN
jgi:thymidylate kinase